MIVNLELLIRFPELLHRDSASGIGRIKEVSTATPSYTLETPTSEPAVSVRELRKTYPGGVEALRGISFDVCEGEIFGMVGPKRSYSEGSPPLAVDTRAIKRVTTQGREQSLHYERTHTRAAPRGYR